MNPKVDLVEGLERFLSAKNGQGPERFGLFVELLKQASEQGCQEDVRSVLRSAIVPTLDYTSLRGLYRLKRHLSPMVGVSQPMLRLAVLGGFTTDQLTQLIDLFLFGLGICVEIYEAEYGVFRQEIIDQRSDLYQFRPHLVYIATTWRDLAHYPGPRASAAQVADAVTQEVAEWRNLWNTAHERAGCQIVMDNVAPPPWRVFANQEAAHPASLGRYVTEVNRGLAGESQRYVSMHDVDSLSAEIGRWTWHDERLYHHAKLPCAPEILVQYAHSVAALVGAMRGAAKKCLVLDLDNTIWGGVIGDDGLAGIAIGQGDPESEAFLAFQRYLKGLRDRGVILATCSKNDERNAREPFEKHAEMVLRLDDISCFVANWNDKATNLRVIAQELNIGLSSLVFVDDSPAERALVRRFVPDVAVPEMPEDPAEYIWAIARHRYFEMAEIATEDFQRTEYYKANAERKRAESATMDIDAYLRSLEMWARIDVVRSETLDRTVQLINKSNQFNLTTRRYSVAQVMGMVQDSRWVTRTVFLADRFGDSGLISVLLARVEEQSLEINTWLMSCRVLKRGVEAFLLNQLCALARSRGLRTLSGEYIPTPKNELVRDHYASLGFRGRGVHPDGRTEWYLDLDSWTPLPHFIKESPVDG
jgi:FkbH-like protein